jgi:hypothetical protein
MKLSCSYPTWILVSWLVLFVSCSGKQNLIPGMGDDVLSREEMTDLLVDINLAESGLRVGNVQRTQASDSLYQQSLFLEVFKKNDVTPDQFNSSLDYYSRRVDDMNEIFGEVINRLTVMQAELQGSKVNNPKKPVLFPNKEGIVPKPVKNKKSD